MDPTDLDPDVETRDDGALGVEDRTDGTPGVDGRADGTSAVEDRIDGTPGVADRAEPGTDVDATPCAYTEYREGPEIEALPATGEGATGLEADVWDALYEVEDPEMPISIVDLGLVYGVEVKDETATVDMTLTYSGCPARDMLLGDVERAIAAVDGIDSVDLRLVWSPEWTVELVTEAGKDDLREFGLSV